MQKKGVIFSDMDGTLCFHQEAHGIREVERYADGTALAEDPLTGARHHAYDVSIFPNDKVYLALETQRLGRRVQEEYDFVLVTGGRPSTILTRKERFNFTDAVILESGAVIFDGAFEPDPVWAKKMEPERESLAGVAASLRRMGWTLDIAGRTSALRIKLKDNPHKTPAEFDALCREISLPATLKKTMNLEALDIILRSAGKDNAIRFWLETHGYDLSRSIGIGDDINDLEFLEITGRKYVLGSSFPEALQVAREKGWYISSQPHFDGINEILEHILVGPPPSPDGKMKPGG